MKLKLILISFLLNFCLEVKSQNKYSLLQTIIGEELYCDVSSLDEYLECLTGILGQLKIETSDIVDEEMGYRKQHVIYSCRLFKLTHGDYTWYILDYNDTNSNGWYRLNGYKENDFIHIYTKVFKFYGLSKKEIKRILKYWRSNELFNEIDFDCLCKSVKSKNNKFDCMISNFANFKYENTFSSGEDIELEKYKKNQLLNNKYSYFSNRLYKGSFPY